MVLELITGCGLRRRSVVRWDIGERISLTLDESRVGNVNISEGSSRVIDGRGSNKSCDVRAKRLHLSAWVSRSFLVIGLMTRASRELRIMTTPIRISSRGWRVCGRYSICRGVVNDVVHDGACQPRNVLVRDDAVLVE